MEPVPSPFLNTATGIVAAHGMIAFFGAVVHASQAHRRGQSKGLLDFVLLTLMSSFSGVIFALVGFQFFDNPYMTLAIAGSGGFLGVEGLTILATKLRDTVSGMFDKK